MTPHVSLMSDDQGTISPGGKHPEQRILTDRLQPPTAGYIAIFRKYCCYKTRGGIITNLTLQNNWGYIIDVSKYPSVGI